ncbi:MAG: hypothetical protein JW917_05895, partial [Ignavibacteria bacterium]|nr:hypothetical protein [Ignavibacteria bacterium]
NLKTAVAYSLTGSMNPFKKESAYLHLPTYTAGILYHFGTFISFVLYFLFLFNIRFPLTLKWVLIFVLIVSGVNGLGIFLKRISAKKIRRLSNPDDFISNLLVTMFQIFTLIMLLIESVSTFYFICASLLFLYIPLGKLKHSLYFFAARYQLGFFYGWRGIWPIKSNENT